MTSLFNSLSGGGGSSSDEPIFDESCGLSRTQRLWAFGGCFVTGMVFSVIGSILLGMANVTGFAIMYSLGGITSLCSTMFLFGPWGQIKRMFDKDRLIATCVYLGSIIITIIIALTMSGGGRVVLVVIFLIIQFFALIWYSLSYVPYGRSMAKTIVTNCFK